MTLSYTIAHDVIIHHSAGLVSIRQPTPIATITSGEVTTDYRIGKKHKTNTGLKLGSYTRKPKN